MLGGKGYLIMNGLAVVGKLEGRVVDAVELPEHLQRAGLAPGEVVGENPRQTLECSPSQGAEEASYAFLVPESGWPLVALSWYQKVAGPWSPPLGADGAIRPLVPGKCGWPLSRVPHQPAFLIVLRP